MKSPRIRHAKQADLELLAAIEIAADQLFGEQASESLETVDRDSLGKAVAGRLLFVAEVENEVVGFAHCHVLGSYLHLHQVSVHPDHGRRGIGRSLVERAIQTSSKRNLDGVTLTTFSNIPWNGPFYLSLGFVPVDDPVFCPELGELLKAERESGMVARIAMCCFVPNF